MSAAAESGYPGGDGVGQASVAMKRGRGRPRGSKNRATLAREAAARAKAAGREAGPSVDQGGFGDAAEARGVSTHSRVITGNAADVVSPTMAPREPCAPEEGEASRPPPGVRGVPAPALAVKAPARRVAWVGLANAP